MRLRFMLATHFWNKEWDFLFQNPSEGEPSIESPPSLCEEMTHDGKNEKCIDRTG